MIPMHPELDDLFVEWTATNSQHIRHSRRLLADHHDPIGGMSMPTATVCCRPTWVGARLRQMDLWEVVARESIRDLVARYNTNGDSGRFTQVLDLFAPDAEMDIDGDVKTGIDEILTIFTSVRDGLTGPSGDGSSRPAYVRHLTATHQIDIVDQHHASGRCYYHVLTHVGLDHWGRYVDEYRTVDEQWRFARRKVSIDGRSPMSLFAPT